VRNIGCARRIPVIGGQHVKSTVERIKRILVSQLEIDHESVSQSGSQTPLLGRGIGLDSVEAMALAVAIEEEFDIEIPDDDLTMELFQSIAALVEYVNRRQSQRGTHNLEGDQRDDNRT